MNPDDLEKHLRSQPMRQVPPQWRTDILSAARQASPSEHAPRTTHHVPRSPSLFSTLLWPHPTAWAGLAAIWLLILGFNLATGPSAPLVAKRASPTAPQVLMAFQEQERLLSELLGPRETPVAERPKPAQPRPRSELRRRLLMA